MRVRCVKPMDILNAKEPPVPADMPISAETFDNAFGVAPNKITHFMDSLGGARKRHADSIRFHELLELAGAMHDRKQLDYGRSEAPFANIEASEEWGVEPWVGSMIRLNDKVRRLQKPAQGGTLSNEGVLDSLMDIAVYALIAYVMYERDHGG